MSYVHCIFCSGTLDYDDEREVGECAWCAEKPKCPNCGYPREIPAEQVNCKDHRLPEIPVLTPSMQVFSDAHAALATLRPDAPSPERTPQQDQRDRRMAGVQAAPMTFSERTKAAEAILRSGYDPEQENGASWRSDLWGCAQKWQDEIREELLEMGEQE
jgi:hypothetical protein